MILESREWNAVARHNGGKHVPPRCGGFSLTTLVQVAFSSRIFCFLGLCYFKGYLKKLVKGSAEQVRLKRT